MSFRAGIQGPEMWPDCYKRGIAAIGYYYEKNTISIVDDCSKLTEEEFAEEWRKKKPKSRVEQGSLKKLAYKMKKEDIIYVKQGGYIVGKGKIKEGKNRRVYQYDPEILKGTESPWEHFVYVDWQKNYKKIKVNLEANLHTVLELDKQRLKKIAEAERKAEEKIKENVKKTEKKEWFEGALQRAESSFRKRNRGLIEQKKSESDYHCEVCDMSFEEVYGKLGKEYIVAHHKKPIGSRKKASKTTLEDIALVCANCHDMLHAKKTPLKIEELRGIFKKIENELPPEKGGK